MSATFPLSQQDLGSQHIERQAEIERAKRLERWTQRLGAGAAAPAPSGSPQPPAGAQPQEPSGLPTQADENRAGERAGAVVGDIGAGLLQAPGEIAGGFLDAQREISKSLGDLGLIPEGIKPLAQQIPEGIGDSDTTTGGAIRSVVQFLTPFVASGSLGAMQRLSQMGTAGKIAAPMARGAIADFAAFDPAQERLSDLVEKVPALANPITEYLQSDPTDSGAEGRFKQAVEGAGLGVAADVLSKGVRALRGVWLAKEAAGVPDEAATAAFRQIDAERSSLSGMAGDPTKPPIEIVPSPRTLAELKANELSALAKNIEDSQVPWTAQDQLAGRSIEELGPVERGFVERLDEAAAERARKAAVNEAVEAATGGKVDPAAAAAAADADRPGRVFVNFSRINSHDDVKAMIQELADARGGNIDAARRGKRSWEATKLDAATKDAWEVLQSRKAGAPLNAEETFAVRELWVRSGARVRELAKAMTANGGDLDQIAFRRQLLVHNAIQEQVIAARTETARALNAWAIPAGDNPNFAGQLDQLRALAQSNAANPKQLQEIAHRITAGADAGLTREVDALIETSSQAMAGNALRQWWYGALLSNPKTHIRNIVGNTAQMLLQIPETRLAAAIGKASGQQAIPDGEAMARLFGLVKGYQDAWTISKKSADVFEAALDQHVNGNPEAAREILAEEANQFFSSGAAEARGGVRGFDAPVSGAFEELMGPALRFLDTATTAPSRALRATDEVFKGMAFNAELQGLAYRQASEELASGKIAKATFSDRLAEILASPTDSMRLAARQSAERQTFTNAPLQGPLWEAVQKFHRVPVLGDIVLPFARTPYNIATQLIQRTPLAPFSKSWVQEIRAGGARADLAWSKFVLGNGVLLTTANLAINGLLTGEGPSDPAERATLQRQGWQPWSVKVGDRYFDYRSLGTVGPAIGLAANTVEILNGQDWDDAEGRGRTQQLVIATSMSIAAQVSEQSFMTGVSSFFDAMSDPQRYGAKWWNQLVTSAVIPRGVAQLERTQDPNQRIAWEMGAALRSQTPGLSKSLPPARDLWGRELKSGAGFGPFYDMLSPFGSSKLDPQPIDTELERLEKWVGTPDRKVTFRGASVDLTKNPRAYSRYVQLAGNETKIGDAGLMDTLNAIISGEHAYSESYENLTDGPDGSKAMLIDRYVSLYREAAKRQLLEEFPELRDEVERKQAEKTQRLTPQ